MDNGYIMLCKVARDCKMEVLALLSSLQRDRKGHRVWCVASNHDTDMKQYYDTILLRTISTLTSSIIFLCASSSAKLYQSLSFHHSTKWVERTVPVKCRLVKDYKYSFPDVPNHNPYYANPIQGLHRVKHCHCDDDLCWCTRLNMNDITLKTTWFWRVVYFLLR